LFFWIKTLIGGTSWIENYSSPNFLFVFLLKKTKKKPSATIKEIREYVKSASNIILKMTEIHAPAKEGLLS
jgi:hypothetical protein